MIDQNDIEKFKREYRADVTKSQKQYFQATYPPLGIATSAADQIQTSYEDGVDITVMQSKFEQLLTDAEAGREFRIMRSRHPGVLEAWDKYRMMLILAYRDEGLDPP